MGGETLSKREPLCGKEIRSARSGVDPSVAMALSAAESNGSSQDTEALYREHGSAVATLCRSLLRDRAEAEDATQQVFLSAHRALLRGTTPREPLAWLLTVARHECYARFRERAVAPLPTGDVPEGAATDASTHVLRAGELASVWDEVGQMPPAQREAFLLREIRGLSYGQLAAELSLSPPSVRSLLLRARTRLRRRLRDVAAFGGAPWLQGLVRLMGGGDGASPVPAATKAAAVGLGALALVGGGDVARQAHHAAPAVAPATAPQRSAAHKRHVSAPAAAGASVRPERHRSGPVHARSRADTSATRRPSEREGTGSGGTSDGGHDAGSGGTTTVATVQPTSDGHDGGSSTSSSSGPGPGPSSGSDGGSGSVTTTTTTSDSGDGSGSTTSGSDGSGSSDGSSSHDGGISSGHGG
jgi:RNA polymerase sigma-70 factor, ECF subfamily